MSGLDDVQLLSAGLSLDPQATKFDITLASKDSVEIGYDRKTQLAIQIEPLGSSPNIDVSQGDSAPLKLTAIAKEASKNLVDG